jgi:RNA-directed DNA polymerase
VVALIARLNPIIRGWAAYYRGVVSSAIFGDLDHHLWWLTWRWAVHRHPNKPRKWIKRRYFGKFNKFRDDHWVFGERADGKARHLVRFSWTPIVRHRLVRLVAIEVAGGSFESASTAFCREFRANRLVHYESAQGELPRR